MITLKTPQSSFSFLRVVMTIILLGAGMTGWYALYKKVYKKNSSFFSSNSWIAGYTKLNSSD